MTAECLIRFLEVEKVRFRDTYGLKHPDDILRKFIFDLATYAFFNLTPMRFEWDTIPEKHDEIKANLAKIRPRLIGFLDYIGETMWLLKDRQSEVMLDDPLCLSALKKRVLEEKLFLFDSKGEKVIRKPRNIDEAISGGSVAAMVFHALQKRKTHLKSAEQPQKAQRELKRAQTQVLT
jgi:hypothetical protein